MTKSALKRFAAVTVAAVLAVTVAECPTVPVHAETTLERLQRAKEEKEKTEDAKENTEEDRKSTRLNSSH